MAEDKRVRYGSGEEAIGRRPLRSTCGKGNRDESVGIAEYRNQGRLDGGICEAEQEAGMKCPVDNSRLLKDEDWAGNCVWICEVCNREYTREDLRS